jgi:dienelactone hydrolase
MRLVVFACDATPDDRPLQRVSLRVERDSVIAEVNSGGAGLTHHLATEMDAMPMVNGSTALFEVALARARRAGRWPARFPVFFTTGGQTVTASFAAATPESISALLGTDEFSIIADTSGRIRRVHLPSQRMTVVRVEEARAAYISLGRPDYSAPADAPYVAEEIWILTPPGHVLGGTLTRPKQAKGRVPAVLAIPGSGRHDRDDSRGPFLPAYRPFRQVADALGRRGIATLRFDGRNYRASGRDGAVATPADLSTDVRAAVAWLRARSDIDPGRIALLAHGPGGPIALGVAFSDSQIAAIALLASPAPIERPTRVKAPVLILQGATDPQVKTDPVGRLAGALRESGSRNVTVRTFPGLNHLFLPDPSGDPAGYPDLGTTRLGDDVLRPLSDWLASQLVPRKPRSTRPSANRAPRTGKAR